MGFLHNNKSSFPALVKRRKELLQELTELDNKILHTYFIGMDDDTRIETAKDLYSDTMQVINTFNEFFNEEGVNSKVCDDCNK